MDSKYKVLIIGAAWVGDMVMSQTLFKRLARQYGDRLELDVFANSWAAGLLERMPEVNQVIPNPFLHGKLALLKRVRVGLQLRYKHYDQVFLLPNSLKSAVIPFFAGIKRRTGFVGESRYILLNNIYKLDKDKLPLMIDRFCALANNGKKPEQIDYPHLTVDPQNQELVLNKLGLDLNTNLVAFCPAAEYGPSKRWLPEHFAKLADMLTEQGYKIVIMGSNKDIEISQTIIDLAVNKNALINSCGKTSLVDTVDLLAKMKYVVTNDSGLMHIAAAVGSKIVALYGSTSPAFTPPLTGSAKILQIKLDCSPCFERTCRFNHYNCMRFIKPESVFQQIIS